MMTGKSISSGFAVLMFGALTFCAPATLAKGAELPKSTQLMLKDLKVNATVLKGLDEALAVPKSILDGAKKEGEVHITGTYDPKQFRSLSRPFKERYPWLDVRYVRASRYDRVIKPIIALKSGKVLFDVIMGIGGQAYQFQKLNALADLTDIPVYKQVPKYMKSASGQVVGMRLLTRCFGYNTEKVKAADLPKSWGDIVTSKRWANQNLAVVNRANYWALHLWVTQGEDWTKKFLTKLFHDLKPQLRKEASNAVQQLLGAGEFDGLLVGTVARTAQLTRKGSPIALHCPEPIVPTQVSALTVLKGGKVNAGKLFSNWFLTREGQVAQYHAARYLPFYTDLQKAGLNPLPNLKIDDSKRIYFREDSWPAEAAAVAKFWENLWLGRQGLKLRTVKVMIDAAKRGGRRYHFKVDGKAQKVRVSSSRTVVTLNGARAGRKSVKKGMLCTITYPGNDQTAKSVACAK